MKPKKEKLLKELLKDVFEAGRRRGQDEINSGSLKYDYEITQPNFEEWYKENYD